MLLKKRYFLFLRIKKKKKKKKIGLSLFPTKAALSHDSFSKQNNCHYEPFYPIISKSRHRFSANFFSWFPSVLCFGSIGKKREREREREKEIGREEWVSKWARENQVPGQCILWTLFLSFFGVSAKEMLTILVFFFFMKRKYLKKWPHDNQKYLWKNARP